MYRCPSLLLVALFAITACDETLTVDNTAPKVEVTGWCTEADHLFVTVVVADFESDPVDLSLLVDGEAILAGPAGDGPRGLSSSRGTGEAHRIHWASPTDLSADAASAACALDDFSGAATCTPTPEPLPGTVQLVPVTREGGAGDPATLMGAPAPCPATPLPGPPDAARTPVDGAPSDATTRDATPPDAGAPDASALDAMAHDGASGDAARLDAAPADTGAIDAAASDAAANDAAANDGPPDLSTDGPAASDAQQADGPAPRDAALVPPDQF